MKISISIFFYFFFIIHAHSQERDTVYVIFNNNHEEMMRTSYRSPKPAQSEEQLEESKAYFICQMETETYSDTKFMFSHAHRPGNFRKIANYQNPVILIKKESFLKNKKVLDIQFFRTTPYVEVCKTFEEENSWQQDVLIFMVDVDETKNDSIVLREVSFSRPVKQ